MRTPLGSRATAQSRPRLHGSATTTSWEVIRVEVGGVDRGLEIHPEDRVVQEHIQRPLVLHVATGGTEGHVRRTIFERERRRQRRTGPLARLEGIRQTLGQPEHLSARAEAEAETRHGWGTLQPSPTRCRRDHVAPAVDDVYVTRIAARWLSSTDQMGRSALPSSGHGSQLRHPAPGAARSQLAGGSGTDESAPLGCVPCGQQVVEGNIDVSRVAVEPPAAASTIRR